MYVNCFIALVKESSNDVQQTQDHAGPDPMLRLNLERIRAKFASLLFDVQTALETKQVMIDRVRQFLINSSQGDLDIPCFSEFSAMFMSLTKHKVWTYQHHSPLEVLTENFLRDDHVIQDKIVQYKGDFSGFLVATKLIEYIKLNCLLSEEMEEEEEDIPLPKFTKKQYRSLKVVLNLDARKISELSLNYVHELWEKLAEEFDLPSLTAVIRRIVDGSLEITWLVLRNVVEKIMLRSRTTSSVKFYHKHQIVLLVVDDMVVYDGQQMVTKINEYCLCMF